MSEYATERGRGQQGGATVTASAPRERSPEEKARAASSVATNLEHAHAAAVSEVEGMWRAHHARDLPAYTQARAAAERAVGRVRDLARGALAQAQDATDPATRARLEQASALADVDANNLAAAPAAPAPVAPTLRMEAVLLSALPPVVIEGSRKQAFDTARRATSAVLAMLPFTDIQALELILRDFPTHEIAVRFRTFANPNALLAIIKDPKIRARARAMEPAIPKVETPPPPAFKAPALLAPPPAFGPVHETPELATSPETAEQAPKQTTEEAARRASLIEVQAIALAGQLWAEGASVDSPHGHHAFLNTLDRIDEPVLRKKVAEKFQQMSGGQSLEDFIKNADWAGKRDQAMALSLISSERGAAELTLAKKSPKERRELRAKAAQWAQQVLDVTRIDGANNDANAQKIARVLGPRTPEEIEAIRAAMRTNTHGDQSLYQEVDRSLSGGNEDEAVAGMSGRPAYAALVGLRNADGDPERVKELLHGLDEKHLAELRMLLVSGHDWVLALVPEGPDRDEVRALLEGRPAAANAARIANLLKRPKDGARIDVGHVRVDEQTRRNMEERKTENVIKELESKSPAEVLAARNAWNTDPANLGHSFEQMLDERFGDEYSVEKARIAALLRGDRASDKALQLREAMRRHDRQEIESTLANPDLRSDDRDKQSAAATERAQIEAKVKDLDAGHQRWTAIAEGRATDRVEGRTLAQQLDASYAESVDDPRTAGSFRERVMIAQAPELGREQRTLDAKERRAEAEDMHRDGALSVEAQIDRAKKSGDQQSVARFAENLPSGTLAATEKRFRTRYGKEMLDEPDLAKYQLAAEIVKESGDERTVEEIELDFARHQMNAGDLRVDNVREYGVKADRRADTEDRLQKELSEKQHSDTLDRAESMRAFWGGNVGTEELIREQSAAMGDQFAPAQTNGQRDLRAGVDPSEFWELDRNLTSSLEVQRDEKLKLANHVSKIFMTIVKLAAFAAGQPHIVAWIDILGGMANIAIKKQIAGEAYDPAEDAKLLAITAAVDIATAGIAGKGPKPGQEALVAVGSEVGRHTANLAVASAGIVASGIVEGRSPTEILGDVIKGGLTQFLPQAIRQKVIAAVGDGSRARAVLAELAGMAAEIKANVAINGSDSVLDAVVMTLGTRIHEYLSTLPPNPSPMATKEEAHATPQVQETAPSPREKRVQEQLDPHEEAAARAAEDAARGGEARIRRGQEKASAGEEQGSPQTKSEQPVPRTDDDAALAAREPEGSANRDTSSASPDASQRVGEGEGTESGLQRRTVDIDPTNDVARLQTKGIDIAIAEGQSSLDWNARSKDGKHTLAEVYKAWIEGAQPVDFSAKQPRANFMGDDALRPYFDEFREVFDGIVQNPGANVTLNVKARNNAAAISDLNLTSLDPTNPNYYVDRAKLVEKLGPEVVARYEAQVLNLTTESQDRVREKVRMVIPDDAVAKLQAAFPEAEIYIYGSSAQPNKKDLALIRDVDVMLVVPDGTPGTKKAQLENLGSSMTVPTTAEFAAATNKTELPIDVTARTRSDAIGLMTVDPGVNPRTGTARTPLEYARIDAHEHNPFTPAEREVVKTAFEKVGKGQSPSHQEMAELTRMVALGKIDPTRLPPSVKDALPNHTGTDRAAIRQWAHELAESTPESMKMTPEQAKADTDDFIKRRERVDELYQLAIDGSVPTPSGVSKERLQLAVKGDPKTGERVPLTYGADPQEAANLFHQFQAELKAVFASEGITDAVVVQLGSGTTGWSNAPGKTGKAWTPKSDVDFAIFSEQALEQAMKQNVPINDKNTQSGRYTTLANNPKPEKGRMTGMNETPLGRKLEALSARWNEIIFRDPAVDGFDLKLNLDTDKPFRSAVPVVHMETPKPLTTPETNGTRAVLVDGRAQFLGVPLDEPKMASMIPEQTVGRREYHITVLSPPEFSNLSAESRALVEGGVDIPGTPRGQAMVRRDYNGKHVYMMEVDWPEADAFRATLRTADGKRLGPKHFHVTLNGGIGAAQGGKDE